MLVNKAAGREWKATDHPGIDRSLFRHNETGGRSSVVRLAAGRRRAVEAARLPRLWAWEEGPLPDPTPHW